MTTPTLAPDRPPTLLALHGVAKAPASATKQPSLLVVSEDEKFWRNFSAAASQAGRKLVRKRSTADAPRTVRLLRPAAILLDLDIPSAAAWDVADSLLQDENCPLLLLLTSRSEHVGFNTAIQVGSLLDKGDPVALVQLVNQRLGLPRSTHREQNAMQRIVIRWLKPCSWSAEVIAMRRFWGINE